MKFIETIKGFMYDYRYKVPSNAGICFAYYLIMAIFPIASLCAFLASLFEFDLSLLTALLNKYLQPEFSSLITNVLMNNNLNTMSLIVFFISIFVVSRGVSQLYTISKNMFPPTHERTTLLEELFTIGKTLGVIVLLILIIVILAIFPIFAQSLSQSHHFIIDEIILFFIFYTILFLLYKIIPDVHVNIVDIGIGSIVASVLLVIVLNILEVYFGLADYNTVYGPLASVVVIMISFSIVAEVIYFGMYVMFESHMLRLVKEMEDQYNISVRKKKSRI